VRCWYFHRRSLFNKLQINCHSFQVARLCCRRLRIKRNGDLESKFARSLVHALWILTIHNALLCLIYLSCVERKDARSSYCVLSYLLVVCNVIAGTYMFYRHNCATVRRISLHWFMEYCYYTASNIYHIETVQIKYLDRYKACFIQFIIFCTIKLIPKKKTGKVWIRLSKCFVYNIAYLSTVTGTVMVWNVCRAVGKYEADEIRAGGNYAQKWAFVTKWHSCYVAHLVSPAIQIAEKRRNLYIEFFLFHV
jgi:hypothetical protein